MDDIDFAFMSEGEQSSRYDLKAEFYRRNRFKAHYWDGSSSITASRPLAFIRHDKSELIRVQYGYGYFVVVERGFKLLSGPHRAQLFRSSPTNEDGIWLGTLQLDGAFYDDKGIKKQLRLAIKQKEYWASDESEEEIVETIEPEVIMELPEREEILPLSQAMKSHREWKIPLEKFKRIVPYCPRCKVKKKQWRDVHTHYEKKHGKSLLIFTSKPIDKCPPM